jgi:serine/threonine protein kinase
MELLNGHSLAVELKHKKVLPPTRVAEILVPICNVLTEAHNQGIVHRDIKPDNIFLHQTAEGEIIKVVDFGLAKIFDSNADPQADRLTLADDVLGTPAYMAPERIQGNSYDGQTDVYSLGVMLYEMLAGCLPFFMKDKNPYSYAIMHVTAQPKPLRAINSRAPIAIETIVMQTLKKNPAERPTPKQLAQQFCQALGLSQDAVVINKNPESRPALIDAVFTRSDSLTIIRDLPANQNDQKK